MKKIFTYILTIASVLFFSVAAFADDDPNPKAINLKKSVTKIDRFNYKLTLEAYVTGSSVTTTTQLDFEVPCDIVLLLDESSSMGSHNVTIEGQPVTGPLTVGTTYKVKINNTEYYLKGFLQDNYTAQASAGYSYNTISNSETDYYLKYNNNYYKVSGSSARVSGSTRYYLTFKVGSTTYYVTSSGGASTNRSSGAYATSTSGTIFTGALYTFEGSSYYYRYGSTEPSSYTGGTEFYTGTTNYSATTSDNIFTVGDEVTREVAMKQAACQFVQTVFDNNPEEGDKHSLAVGYFSKTLTWLIDSSTPLVELSSSSEVEQFQSAISTVSNSQGTDTHKALGSAYDMLDNYKTDGHNKVVVLFTDGEPTETQNTFDVGFGQSGVENAYKIKNNLPNTLDENGNFTSSEPTYSFPAVVYTIAILSSETAQKNSGTTGTHTYDIRRFLHYVSSNYNFGALLADNYYFSADHPDAVCQIEGAPASYHGSEDPHDYYQLSNGSDLSSIFQSIAESASQTSGGASYALTAESTTVIDIITEDFSLPQGVSTGDILVYTADAVRDQEEPETGEDGRKWYTFGTPVLFTSADIEVNTVINAVSVGNFGFSDPDTKTNDISNCDGNWVGPRTGGNQPDGIYGKELIIEIPIVLNPDFDGGYNDFTNSPLSGIYVDGVEKAMFNIPYYDFPSIAIRKWGLKQGESALFSVLRLTDKDGVALTGQSPYVVSVTGTNDNGEMAYTIIKDIPEGKYRISEMDWSWTYNIAQPASGVYVENVLSRHNALEDETKGGEVDGVYVVIFDFRNEEKTLTTKHAESVVINDFRTGESVSGRVGGEEDPGEEGL